jgi:SGNH hydrolase-like domain, acetyltransferase AlgX
MLVQSCDRNEEHSWSAPEKPPRISGVSRLIPLGRSRLFWLVYGICLVLFVEACLQLYYRITTGALLYRRDKPPIWATDPYSGWTNRPDFTYRHVTPEFAVDLYTNSQGFRVSEQREEYSRQKSPGTFRILLLGPSFAYGWGTNFEDTFGEQLRQVLGKSRFMSGHSIEVLNHGVPALPAANQLEWFRQVGSGYAPDLVIHFVYGSLEVSPQPDRTLLVTDGLLQQAWLSNQDIMWGYAKNFAIVFYSGVFAGQISQAIGTGGGQGRIEGAGRELHMASAFDAHSPTVTASTNFYRAFQDAVHEARGKFLAVHFPLSYVVYPKDQTRWALHGVENIEAQVTYNQAFSAHLNQQAIPCLNLTQDLIEAAKHDARRFYYWLDVHWTPVGNRRSAELVSQYLEQTYRGGIPGADDLESTAQGR